MADVNFCTVPDQDCTPTGALLLSSIEQGTSTAERKHWGLLRVAVYQPAHSIRVVLLRARAATGTRQP